MPDEEPTHITPKAQEQIKALQLTVPQVTRTASVLNAAQINAIFNSTPRKYKYSRPGKGGGNWTYVRAGYVRQRLDSIFGFNWDFEVETSVGEALDVAQKTGTVVVKGKLTGRIMHLANDDKGKLIGGELITTITKADFGRQEVKFKKNSKDLLDFGNDLKGAATDCFKRCAARFGIAADVYDPLEFMAIEVVAEEPTPAKSKKLERQITQAQAVIDEQAKEVGGQNGSK